MVGALLEGRYATVVLQRAEDGQWALQRVTFERLPK